MQKDFVMFVKVKLGGRLYKMPINFAVTRDLSAAGISPSHEVAKSTSEGYSVSIMAISMAFYIGASADGCELTIEQIGEEIIKNGAHDYAVVFGIYMLGFMTGGLPSTLRISDVDPGKKKTKVKKKRTRKKTRKGSRTRSK